MLHNGSYNLATLQPCQHKSQVQCPDLVVSSASLSGALARRCFWKGVQAVAEVDMPKSVNLSEANGKQLQRLLVLEGLQDPGNLVGP